MNDNVQGKNRKIHFEKEEIMSFKTLSKVELHKNEGNIRFIGSSINSSASISSNRNAKYITTVVSIMKKYTVAITKLTWSFFKKFVEEYKTTFPALFKALSIVAFRNSLFETSSGHYLKTNNSHATSLGVQLTTQTRHL